MIAEVRGLATLKGFRGKPKGDLDALAQAIVALSQLADDPAVLEAEINPLIVKTEGVAAVDAVVRLALTTLPTLTTARPAALGSGRFCKRYPMSHAEALHPATPPPARPRPSSASSPRCATTR